jgi:hypothetical protein
MRVGGTLFFLVFTAAGFIAVYFARGHSSLYAVYVDRYGKRWRVPSNGFVTKVVNKCIEMIPRWSRKFEMIDPDFDLDNETYVHSSMMYIVFCGLIGIFFLLCIGVLFHGPSVENDWAPFSSASLFMGACRTLFDFTHFFELDRTVIRGTKCHCDGFHCPESLWKC